MIERVGVPSTLLFYIVFLGSKHIAKLSNKITEIHELLKITANNINDIHEVAKETYKLLVAKKSKKGRR